MPKVKWTVLNGYATDGAWVSMGDDYVYHGVVQSYIEYGGVACAIIKVGSRLTIQPIEDLEIVEDEL